MNIILIIIIIITIITIFIIYNLINKLINNIQKLYIGCLYSSTGNMGEFEKANYNILIDSLNFLLKTYKLNYKVNIIPIFKDLKSNDDNYELWIKECIKNYNIKFFFGCWKSSQRKKIIPIINKYNLRLFYPLQYEGNECNKNIYYFGATPNQQIFPAINFYFNKYSKYKDVYIIGSNYEYPIIVSKSIINYINDNFKDNVIKQNIFQDDNNTNFNEFIDNLFNDSTNGAIIICNINGSNIYNFFEQIHSKYKKNNNDNNNLDIKKTLQQKYPIICFSFPENNIDKEKIYLFKDIHTVWNFSNKILYNSNYRHTNINVINNLNFLIYLNKKYKKPIGDTQYCTYISLKFFISSIKNMIDKNVELNNTDNYDKYKNRNIETITGDIELLNNNHINKCIYWLSINNDGDYIIDYDNYRNIEASPYSYIKNNVICNLYNNNNKNNLYII